MLFDLNELSRVQAWSAQEHGISAILSGDKNMLQSYESGDPYMSFAILAGAAPPGASKSTHPTIRRLYKTASLAISYGQEVHAFASRAKVPLCTAQRVLADYERLYHRFLSWRSQDRRQLPRRRASAPDDKTWVDSPPGCAHRGRSLENSFEF